MPLSARYAALTKKTHPNTQVVMVTGSTKLEMSHCSVCRLWQLGLLTLFLAQQCFIGIKKWSRCVDARVYLEYPTVGSPTLTTSSRQDCSDAPEPEERATMTYLNTL